MVKIRIDAGTDSSFRIKKAMDVSLRKSYVGTCIAAGALLRG
jgi:hypothetical protein